MYRFIQNIPSDITVIKRHYKKDETILSPSDNINYLYIITHGQATVYMQGEQGEIVAIYEYSAIDYFGEIELLNENANPLLIKANIDCSVLLINKSDFLAWLKRDFNFSMHIMVRLTEKLLHSSNGVGSLTMLTLQKRYIRSMQNHVKKGDIHIVTKKQIAEEIFAPIRSLNRVIKQNNAIVCYANKTFKVMNEAKLFSLI